MWWWSWAIAHGQAAVTVDGDELDRMVAELYPRVAAHVGRPPAGVLRSGILPLERIRAAVRAPTPVIGARAPSLETVEPTSDLVERSRLAVYVGQLRGIYLVQETIESLFATQDLEPGQLRPILRCLVVHELVHALQHAYGGAPTEGRPDLVAGQLALREGHATAVGLELCAAWEGPDTARRVSAIQGVDAVGTLDPASPATPYAWGRSLAEMLIREDPELMWAALVSPPPGWTDIVHDLRPILGGGWEDPAPITAALEVLGAPKARPHPDTPRTLGPILGAAGFDLPPATAGWFARTGSGAVVAAYRMDGSAALIAARAEQARRQSTFPVELGTMDPVYVAESEIPRLEKRDDVIRTLRLGLSATHMPPYRERWVATDHVLALVVTRDTGSANAAVRALEVLLDQLPGPPGTPTEASLPSLAGWLADVRAHRPSVEATPDPEWRQLDAAAAWQHGVVAPCGPAFGDVLVAGAVREPEAWARAAYDCAAAAQEPGTADRAVVFLEELPAIPAAIHAQALGVATRFDDALAVLDRATPTTPAERRAVTDVRMEVLGAARRWTELAVAAALPDGSTELRLQVAVMLRELGRTDEATHLFALACFIGEGPPPAPCTER